MAGNMVRKVVDNLPVNRMRINRRGLIRASGVLAAGAAFGGALAACSRTEPGDDNGDGGGRNTLSEIQDRGIARLAIGNEPPYTQIDSDGTVTGAAPEVAKAVLAKLGIDEVEGIVTPYESMIAGLNAQRWDLVTAGLFMNQTRCAEVLYSDPDVVSTESFLVPEGNPQGLLTVADVADNPDVRLIVISGSSEEGFVASSGIDGDQINPIQDAQSGFEALEAGRGDAFMLPTLSLIDLLGEDPDGFDITEPLPDGPLAGAGAAFHSDDEEFRDAYNEAFRELKDSGEFAEILEPWGFSAEAAINATTEELCETEG